MAMGSFTVLGIFLMGAALAVPADEAGRAAAKGYLHEGAKPASGKAAPAHTQDSAPGPGRMQVEEPSTAASDPDARDSKAWQKSHAKGLTDAQKAAFRERKEKMEGMIALIKAKRKALRDAKPGERAALARELHSLILEKDSDPSQVASAAALRPGELEAPVPVPAEVQKEVPGQRASEAQSQRREEIRERQKEHLKKLKAKGQDD
jgi:hypothetical protein